MKHLMKTMLATTALISAPVAFENKNGWKVDDDGKLVVDDKGNPIYIGSDGKEQSVLGDTISRLNGEAKSHREAKEAAVRLKKFVTKSAKVSPRKSLKKIKRLKVYKAT